MPLPHATRLGPYQIVAPLGAGGMGEVYRAHDTRLGRDVALKVLPQDLAATPEARARFEREARTISQLNHPHICSLYDVGYQDGTDYLVMELIEGETLADRLAKGPLPVAEVLLLGGQIAEALRCAHPAGVVHRDLKPGNIMLARGGAKLMDFGLARVYAHAPASEALTQSPTVSRPLTAEGTILGTFQYMAPELLEGKEADPRSDLWGLGCVLYEMATGTPAFAGESQASLIAAIMGREPRPMAELRPLAPPGLERVVERCLRKDPAERFQSAADLAFTLDLIAGGALGAAPGSGAAAAARSRRAAPLAFAALVLVTGLAAFFAGRLVRPPAEGGSLRVATLSNGSRDAEPAVSPDGRMVAFSAVRPGGEGIWLMDMVTRGEVRLTDRADNLPRFSPDGGTVLFTRAAGDQTTLWRVPVLGGSPRPLLDHAADADWSPDGSRIAYLAGSTDSVGVRARLMTARSDGTEPRELWSASSVVLANPRWSPDGKRVAVIRAATGNAPNAVLVVDASNGSVREYPPPNRASLSNACWDGTGDGLIVVEGEGIVTIQRGLSGRLLRLDVRSGAFRPLGWLTNFPYLIDLLPDGRIVMSGALVRQNLREVPIGARSLGEGRWLTSGVASDRQPVHSPDGRWVMFSSNRDGTLDLWEVSVESGELRRVTDDPADDWDPAYGPDGNSIYWSSNRGGTFEIWTARRDGSAPRQISRDSLDSENPACAPDGRWVLYSSGHPGKSGLWRVPSVGGEAEYLLRGGSLIPDLSRDGRLVSVILGVGTLAPVLAVFDLERRVTLPQPVTVRQVPGNTVTGRSRWMPDGSAVVYVGLDPDGRGVLVRRPLEAWRGGAVPADTLFGLSTEIVESFGISPDGRRITVSVLDYLSGLMIAEGVQGIVPPKRPPAGAAR